MKHQRSFALVLTIFLVALLATSGVGLALTAATESITADWVARDLDHRLAVDSLLTCLPQLLRAREATTTSLRLQSHPEPIGLTLSECQIQCRVHSERDKLPLGTETALDTLTGRLRELARTHGLPQENVKLHPIVLKKTEMRLPGLVWFDQIVEPTEMEEIFRQVFHQTDDKPSPDAATWSDLVSFWNTGAGPILALEVETRCGTDRRRWYLVVSLADSKLVTLYRGSV